MFGKLLCLLGLHEEVKVYRTKSDIRKGNHEIHCERCKKILKGEVLKNAG